MYTNTNKKETPSAQNIPCVGSVRLGISEREREGSQETLAAGLIEGLHHTPTHPPPAHHLITTPPMLFYATACKTLDARRTTPLTLFYVVSHRRKLHSNLPQSRSIMFILVISKR
ncbi:hypothetical protein E2C01_090260 [Portunus trituberculatus]|uniref:Uncharacterized protein n=1 Tax=Portunus trituberculatus TaxID=210409 RepID=A0A5B7JKF1_PORTR|nr:hypothetical protein [Portunus trituberculatus]